MYRIETERGDIFDVNMTLPASMVLDGGVRKPMLYKNGDGW